MPVAISLIGRTFGRLKVLEDCDPIRTHSGISMRCSKCLCSCGKTVIVKNIYLRAGDTESCGCIQSERARVLRLRHGHCRKGNATSIHVIWWGIHQRCLDPNCKAYPRYGGRGIKLCKRWMKFENFLSDMGERPSKKSIERINNDGNYEPSNCKWATGIEQGQNKRNNRTFTVRGITACISELCRRFHISSNRVQARLRYGWPAEDAFTRPLRHRLVRSPVLASTAC